MTEHTPNDEALDARLRALGGVLEDLPSSPDEEAAEPEGEGVPLETILALRAGTLSDEEAAEVEQALVEDPAARAMLYDLDAPLGDMEQWAVGEIEKQVNSDTLLEGEGAGIAKAVSSSEASNIKEGPSNVVPFPKRWTTWAGSGVIAAAAALVLVLMRPDSLPPPSPYQVAAVQGMIQEIRGEEDPHAKRIFDAVSEIRITLKPEQAPDGKAPALQVFVDTPEGLKAVTTEIKERKGAFLLKAKAGAIFGTRTGKRFVYVALAKEAKGLEGLAGTTAKNARENSALRWIEIPVTYRGEQPP
ncbi:MAG: hypothetical protein ACE366_13500 [Bradymonadia bacterium]